MALLVVLVTHLQPAFFVQPNAKPRPQQRGHRVRPQDLEDLPNSWARQAKLRQLDSVVPASHHEFLVATFAAGCYWGPELAYQRQHGVVATCVGHTGYQSGGANEAVQLLYDPQETTYQALLDVLWGLVEPTLKNRVGNDRGAIYRHAIYAHSPEQHEVAMRSLAEQQVAAAPATVWTQLEAAQLFYVAQPRHQRYLERGMKGNPQLASKGCTDPIRCYGGVGSGRRAGPIAMRVSSSRRAGEQPSPFKCTRPWFAGPLSRLVIDQLRRCGITPGGAAAAAFDLAAFDRSPLQAVQPTVAASASAKLRRDDLEYPAADGGSVNSARLYTPVSLSEAARGEPAPLLVYLHGGGWVLNDARSQPYDALCAELAEALGFCVLSLNYRLAPEHSFPAAPEDVYAALTWLAAQPAVAPLADRRRLVLMGESAGANLAAVVALMVRDRQPAGIGVAHQVLLAHFSPTSRPHFAHFPPNIYIYISFLPWPSPIPLPLLGAPRCSSRRACSAGRCCRAAPTRSERTAPSCRPG